jgi:hypothetical protein
VSEFTKRAAEREAFCRWCDSTIPKGSTMVTGTSWRNRGISMHFCLPCAEKIGDLAKVEQGK